MCGYTEEEYRELESYGISREEADRVDRNAREREKKSGAVLSRMYSQIRAGKGTWTADPPEALDRIREGGRL